MSVHPFDPTRRRKRGGQRHYRSRHGGQSCRQDHRGSGSLTARLVGACAAVFAVALLTINGDARQIALAAVNHVARDGSEVQGQVDDLRRSQGAAIAPVPAASAADRLDASFGLCHTGGGTNCVVDGDTFWFRGEKIRIADIDTPETHPPRCANEAEKGRAATLRLHALLNAGAFSLEPIDRDRDVYGRKLRVVTRGGQSLGGVLVSEGLAHWYAGGRRGWC